MGPSQARQARQRASKRTAASCSACSSPPESATYFSDTSRRHSTKSSMRTAPPQTRAQGRMRTVLRQFGAASRLHDALAAREIERPASRLQQRPAGRRCDGRRDRFAAGRGPGFRHWTCDRRQARQPFQRARSVPSLHRPRASGRLKTAARVFTLIWAGMSRQNNCRGNYPQSFGIGRA